MSVIVSAQACDISDDVQQERTVSFVGYELASNYTADYQGASCCCGGCVILIA